MGARKKGVVTPASREARDLCIAIGGLHDMECDTCGTEDCCWNCHWVAEPALSEAFQRGFKAGKKEKKS